MISDKATPDLAICDLCWKAETKSEPVETLPELSGIVEWEITDIDYWEQDAILVLDGERIYFQFEELRHPTLADAIKFIKTLK